jgi:phosphate transport system substrate-binding protein
MKLIPVCCAFLTLLLYSCTPNQEETATKGHLHVLVAEAVAPTMTEEVAEFMKLYGPRGADVTMSIVSSEQANARFLQDTARAIVTYTPLTAAEKEQVGKTTDHLADIILAYDGVVALVQHRNAQETLTFADLKSILAGRLTRWDQLAHAKGPQGRIHLVLQDSADVVQYLSQRLLGGNKLDARYHATGSALQTLREVSRDPLALGFVGLDWVDSAEGRVNVLALSADSAFADTTFKPSPESIGHPFSPHPAYIYLGTYPMKRAIHIYARTTPGDFATGFASFLASPAGQKIFLAQGLVPGTQKIVLKPTD